jgi:hypothetical protein
VAIFFLSPGYVHRRMPGHLSLRHGFDLAVARNRIASLVLCGEEGTRSYITEMYHVHFVARPDDGKRSTPKHREGVRASGTVRSRNRDVRDRP